MVEHERLGVTIVTALSDIGDALSRIDFAETLYPTEKMKDTIVTLNCHIITFLLRALDWYETRTVSRAIQSVTRPAALRYDDLIEDIRKTLGKVTDLSVAGSQAEQRDMHEELRQVRDAQDGFRTDVQSRLDEMQHQLTAIIRQQYQERQFQAIHRQLQDLATLVQQTHQNQGLTEQTLLQEVVIMKQDIKATQVNIRHQLSDIQLTQALSFISSLCTIDPKSAYEHALLLRRVRKISSAAKCAPFWNSQQLQSWDQSPSHSSIVLRATFRDRLNIRDFCINVIEQLLRSEVAVLWVLQQKNVDYNIFEVLKSLISQALSRHSSHTDISVSSHIRTFNAVHSLNDYATLLANIFAHFKLIYIVIDTGAISSESVEECRRIFATFPQLLSERGLDTVLKVMFVTHGLTKTSTRDNGQGKAHDQMVLKVGQTSKRKGKRIPQAPLRGKSRFGLKR